MDVKIHHFEPIMYMSYLQDNRIAKKVKKLILSKKDTRKGMQCLSCISSPFIETLLRHSGNIDRDKVLKFIQQKGQLLN